jgi:putative ABC transport system permease protein
MRIAVVVRGREVEERNTASRSWVALVNETAARRFWPGEDPLGRRIRLDVVPEEMPREVVGVVRDVPVRSAQPDPQPVLYASYLQQPMRSRGSWGGMFGQMTFVIRSARDPLGLVGSVRRTVADVEPDRPVAAIGTAEQRLDLALEKRRYFMILAGVLALTAATLAAVGVYGVLTYSVDQRTREIGIRRALGAGPREIVGLVGRRALTLVLAGLSAGSLVALALTGLIASQLWTVAPADPVAFVGTALLRAGIAAAACLGPAGKAIVIDPTVALRAE